MFELVLGLAHGTTLQTVTYRHLGSYALFRTTGKGNCLYNACSLALCGNETLSSYLRCLTSLELYEHSTFYASHPLIESLHNKGAFASPGNAFAMALSDSTLSTLKKDDKKAAVFAEAFNNCRNFAYSSFICLLALLSSVGCAIESYFPIAKENQTTLKGRQCRKVPWN